MTNRRLVPTVVAALLISGVTSVLPANAFAVAHSPVQRPVTVAPQSAETNSSHAALRLPYPIGRINAFEPSGMSPPGPTALHHYRESYVNDFPGRKIPQGWSLFTGVPGGDPDGEFAMSHVDVIGGILHLNTWRDPAFDNEWVTGGICQCGLARLYGAYFVRSRITGTGANEAEVLWPTKGWPPEIDFNETGASDTNTTSTLHFGSNNLMQHMKLAINLRAWHTFGVIWTPTSVTYTVDGREWGVVTATSEIPRTAMTLDFEQRTSCDPVRDCPTKPVSMEVDWVTEYAPD